MGLSVFSFSLIATAQEESSIPPSNGNNEFRMNLLGFIVPGVLDLTYERILDESQGVGFQSSVYLLNLEETEFWYSYSFSAHYRLYTSTKKYASGFFLQAGLNLASVPNYNYSYDSNFNFSPTIEEEFYIGPEVGLGGKWVISKGIVVELGGSISRALNDVNSTQFNGNYWLSIGKRF